MKNGICPKCGSANVHAKPNGLGFGNSSRVNVYIESLGQPASTIAYVCVNCGYFEVYIADDKNLAAIAGAWQEVAPEG